MNIFCFVIAIQYLHIMKKHACNKKYYNVLV